ncbi:MAG TPA: hypothetical protein VEA79_14020 [Phenylobacterium sp.]|nr:hypothetical protein [Phenylobacterium sp.]
MNLSTLLEAPGWTAFWAAVGGLLGAVLVNLLSQAIYTPTARRLAGLRGGIELGRRQRAQFRIDQLKEIVEQPRAALAIGLIHLTVFGVLAWSALMLDPGEPPSAPLDTAKARWEAALRAVMALAALVWWMAATLAALWAALHAIKWFQIYLDPISALRRAEEKLAKIKPSAQSAPTDPPGQSAP